MWACDDERSPGINGTVLSQQCPPGGEMEKFIICSRQSPAAAAVQDINACIGGWPAGTVLIWPGQLRAYGHDKNPGVTAQLTAGNLLVTTVNTVKVQLYYRRTAAWLCLEVPRGDKFQGRGLTPLR